MARFLLSRSPKITNDDWLHVVQNIESLISKEEIDDLTAETVKEMSEAVAEKKVAFAWSGGKDSIVLETLCKMVGVTQGMMVLTKLEYPAYERWVLEHKPPQCHVDYTDHDLKWLANNLDGLFPPMSYQWSVFVQNAFQDRYYREQNLDMMIFGRRTADGNYVGAGTNLYQTSTGQTRYNPMASWKHEHILAFLHYYKLELPPIYQWKNGYKGGTHPWFVRPYVNGDHAEGWKQIFEIDPTIVEQASLYIESARSFMEKR